MIIHEELMALRDKEYGEFSEKLLNTNYEVIGVRLPDLRALGKKAAKETDLFSYAAQEKKSHEEVLLLGIMMGFTKNTISKRLRLIDSFTAQCDSWGQTDSAITGWNWIKKDPSPYREWMISHLNDEREMFRRMALLLAMRYYPGSEDTEIVLESLDQGGSQEYYARMMIAWYLAERVNLYPERIKEYLKGNRLDSWTHNKALQKIRESYRIDQEYKEEMLRLKRK